MKIGGCRQPNDVPMPIILMGCFPYSFRQPCHNCACIHDNREVALKVKPMTTKKVVLHQLCGHRFAGVNEAGDKVIVDGDQPAIAMRPTDLLLTALGSCTAYDVIDIMGKKRQPLARYRIEVEGTQADAHPRRFTQIRVTHYGAGPDVTETALQRSAELSHTKYCPVANSLNADITIAVVVEPWENDAPV
jgi:putative redox protein